MKLPVRKIKTLYHWGTLDAADLGRNGVSHEGNALCASLCPEAWLDIVRLGGNPLNALSNPEGSFVDVLELLHNKNYRKVKSSILQQAHSLGWIEKKDVYRAWTTDEEGRDQFSEYGALEDAQYEVDEDLEGGHVDMVQKWVVLEPLNQLLGMQSRIGGFDGEQYAIMGFVSELSKRGAEIDGCHLNFRYDPEYLQAPLFTILPDRVKLWGAAVVDQAPDDFDLLRTLPKVNLIEVKPLLTLKAESLTPSPK